MTSDEIFPKVGRPEDRKLIRALLQQPRSVMIEAFLNRGFALFFPLIVALGCFGFYVDSLTVTEADKAAYSFSTSFHNLTKLILIFGLILFPRRLFVYFAAAFILSFTIGLYLALAAEVLVAPPGASQTAFVLSALLYNFVVGTAIGLACRLATNYLAVFRLLLPLDIAFVSSIFVANLAIGLTGAVGAVWIAEAAFGLALPRVALEVMALGVLSNSLSFATLMIAVLFPPNLKKLGKALPLLLLFYLSALIEREYGWQDEGFLSMFAVLMLRLIVPVSEAVALTILMLLLQRVVVPMEGIDTNLALLIFMSLWSIVLILDLALINKANLQQQNRRLQSLLVESFESSKVGYFVYSHKLQKFWLDQALERKQGARFGGSAPDLLRHLHPEDARKITAAWSDHTSEPNEMLLRICQTAPYREDGDIQVYRATFLNQRSWYYGQYSVGTLTEVTELHQTAQKLQDTLAQLEMSKERQHRLFAMISHELRTPAALLKMLAEQMEKDRDWQRLGPLFDSELEQLLTLMDDLGSVVRDEDLLPAAEAAFKPNELLQVMRNVYRILASEAGITIELQAGMGYDAPRISDVGRLQQILGNLMRNAVFHSGGDRLMLSYREEDNGGQLIGIWNIDDNGKGIPEALQPGLFEPFNRQTRGVFSESEGTGLGMYIVKLFAENLGGTVAYLPRPAGGACFEVRVPLKPGDLDSAKRVLASPETQCLSVLLVEDNALVADITQSQLSPLFARVDHCEDAETALQQVARHPPEVILTDIRLPGMGGGELIEKLRAGGFKGAIFGLSADSGRNSDLIRQGADGVLTKPLALRRLLQDLEKIRHDRDLPLPDAGGEQRQT